MKNRFLLITAVLFWGLSMSACKKINNPIIPIEHVSGETIRQKEQNKELENDDQAQVIQEEFEKIKKEQNSTNTDTTLIAVEVEQNVPTGNEIVDEAEDSYRILYYSTIDAETPSDTSTIAISGQETEIESVASLGFDNGIIFEGWRLYREVDDKWLLKDSKGKTKWMPLDNGQLPYGYCFDLRTDKCKLVKPTKNGIIKLFAQWGGDEFTGVYHLDLSSEASSLITNAPYGTKTTSLTIADLGFRMKQAKFVGWRLYRELDNKWSAKNGKGEVEWVNLKDGKLPEGYTYSLYKDGFPWIKATTSGIVHAYATWEKGVFTVNYHKNETTPASGVTTTVNYGEKTKSYTISQLGFSNGDKKFLGWKLYRDIDSSWSVKAPDESMIWMKLENGTLTEGYSFNIYRDGTEFKTAAPEGNVHAYALWGE